MSQELVETFYPTHPAEWRQWLQEHHRSKQAVWLVCYKKKSGIPSLTWSEAVDEALCFGWIDSIRKSVDSEKSIQFFSKRKPKGTWSKVNKEKIKVLMETGKMTQAGLEAIEKAKQNGSWTILDEVEELLVPQDLLEAFKTLPGSEEFFMGLSKSVKKMMLYWIVSAKQPATRQKRISELAEMAAQKRKPKQF